MCERSDKWWQREFVRTHWRSITELDGSTRSTLIFTVVVSVDESWDCRCRGGQGGQSQAGRESLHTSCCYVALGKMCLKQREEQTTRKSFSTQHLVATLAAHSWILAVDLFPTRATRSSYPSVQVCADRAGRRFSLRFAAGR